MLLIQLIILCKLTKEFKRDNGWFGYFNPDKTQKGLCGFIDMEPTRARFSFVQILNHI
jgi:hypothetical protein